MELSGWEFHKVRFTHAQPREDRNSSIGTGNRRRGQEKKDGFLSPTIRQYFNSEYSNIDSVGLIVLLIL